MDADGVALAAIQGLNQKFEEQLKRKDAEIAESRRTLTELTQLVNGIFKVSRREKSAAAMQPILINLLSVWEEVRAKQFAFFVRPGFYSSAPKVVPPHNFCNSNALMKTLDRLRNLLVIAVLFAATFRVHAQGTAFTYQGRLNDSGGPFTGNAEFQATLWNAASGGAALASNLPPSVIVPVTNGLFVLPLDFAAAFPGADRWLQFEVRTTIGAFTKLAPRQQLTPTPYAITASNLSGTLPVAQLTGSLSSTQLAGTYSSPITFSNAANVFSGDGAGLTSLDASQLATGTVPSGALSNAWRINGNSGTSPTNGNFIGTTDNQPLELKVNGTRVVRWERQTNAPIFGFVIPNIIAGFESNSVGDAVGGATIAGGGGPEWYGSTVPHRITGSFSTIGGGVGNVIDGVVSTIAGGERGIISFNAYNSFLGGGAWNTIDAPDSIIGGGRNNLIQSNSYAGFIGGGYQNTIRSNGYYSTIGGGYFNTIETNVSYATVPGGYQNSAAASYSFAAGTLARANHSGAFVWADASSFVGFASTAANQFLIRAAGNVGINTASPGAALDVRTTNTSGNVIRFGFYTGGAGNLIAGPSRVGIATDNLVERISINQGTGNVGIGTIAPQTALHVLGTDGLQLRLQNSVNNYNWSIYSESFNNSGNLLFVPAGAPAPNAFAYIRRTDGAFLSGSDKRLKRDIHSLGSVLDRVLQLRPVTYHFRDQPENASRTLGLIAQEVEPLFPEVVGEHGGMKALAYSELIPVTIGAVQELNQKLEETRGELKRRDTENNQLKHRLEALEKIVAHLSSKGDQP